MCEQVPLTSQLATSSRSTLRALVVAVGLLIATLSLPVQAVITITITRGGEGAQPIAIVPFGFAGSGAAPAARLGQIVADDLTRTGLFEAIPFIDLPSRPTRPEAINFRDWRLLQTPNLVIGNVRQLAGKRFAVEFRLYNVFRAEQLTGFQLEVGEADLRRAAHQIADIVFERLTGLRGAFDTRVAYVTEKRLAGKERRYALEVADSDGVNPRTILESKEPVMSPNWSPDGNQIAYVSFEGRRPRIFIQELLTGKRKVVADFPGLNGAPAFSPDGSRLAMVLSKDGNPELYVLYLSGNRLQRLTTNAAIDTEPAWSPDGQTIAFTSDRGGKPQIYKMAATGGQAQRVTFEGTYNARSSYSPDGKKLVMVHSAGKGFQIGVLDLDTRQFRTLTDSQLDESPSFAPNGSMILYATVQQGNATLAAVATDGRMRQRLGVQEGKVREPAWSPYRNQ